jgi:DnaJ-class molecular chaperone
VTGPHGDTNLIEHLLATPRVCPSCKGEGWHYREVFGRFAEHPVIERPCRTCNQTGVCP